MTVSLMGFLILCILAGCGSAAVTDTDTETSETVSEEDLLVSGIISSAASQTSTRTRTDQLIEQLAQLDPSAGKQWTAIMDYWDTVNEDGFVREDLPDTLPQDNSLCLVVLGYALNLDGSMKEELVGRLTRALECAAEYPNAYILVTGGPTASLEKEITEAGAMAEWLVEQGISADRIIVEDQSLTSAENAVFSLQLLREHYQEVKELAMITSDYHVPLGCLLFQTECILDYGEDPEIRVVSNASYGTEGKSYFSLSSQADWMDVLLSYH